MVETNITSSDLRQQTQLVPQTSDAQAGVFSGIGERVGSIKEKIYGFFRYKHLKIKEYFGKINENEFGELLEYDFKDELKDNTPLSKVFSPMEEIKKIKQLPIGGRSVALASFHENNSKQTEAWSSCRVFIERQIEFNPDVDKNKLTYWINKFGTEYGFSSDQQTKAEELIDAYFKKRSVVKELRARYNDDTALVNHLTGLNFDSRNKFSISVGPMSIDIGAKRSAFRKMYAGQEMAANIPYVGYAASKGEGDEEIYYTVMDIGRLRNRYVKKEVLDHEREHLKNRLFRKVFDTKIDKTRDESLWQGYQKETDANTRKGFLRSWFVDRRLEALDIVKDELIAMKKGGWWEVGRFFKKDRSSYDYLASVREVGEKDKEHREISDKLLVREYQKIINSGIKAFDRLERKGKMTRDHVIAMLSNKSIGQWPRAVERFINEQRNSQRLRVAFA